MARTKVRKAKKREVQLDYRRLFQVSMIVVTILVLMIMSIAAKLYVMGV